VLGPLTAGEETVLAAFAGPAYLFGLVTHVSGPYPHSKII